MTIWNQVKEFAFGLWARAVSGPMELKNIIQAATVSVAHSLAKLYNSGLAEDLNALKRTLWRRVEADTDAKCARARKVIAEAVELEQKTNLLKRNDRISKADERVKLAEAAKSDAEAKARLIEANAQRIHLIAEAQANLIESLTAFKSAGGTFGVDPRGLAKLLGLDNLSLLSDEPPAISASDPSDEVVGELTNQMSKAPPSVPKPAAVVPRAPRRDERTVRKEISTIERTIAKLDDQKKGTSAQLLTTSDATEAMRLRNEVESLDTQLAEAEDRWCQLRAEIEGE